MVGLGWTREAKKILTTEADHGNDYASRRLAKLLADLQEFDELQSRAVDDPSAAVKFAEAAPELGRSDEAVRILQAHADNNVLPAAVALADLFCKQGMLEEAVEVEARQYGNSVFGGGYKARLLLEQGRLDELYDLIYTGDFIAARVLEDYGAVDMAITILRDLAYNRGVYFAGTALVDVLVKHQRIDELREEVAAGLHGAAEALRSIQRDQTLAT
jgi:hypothetical protein